MLESNPARRIISKFGGISRMASVAGFPKSTVQRWSDSGRIGPRYNPQILDAAAKNNIALEVADFIDVDLRHPAFVSAASTLASGDTGARAAGSSPDPIPEKSESLAPARGVDDRVVMSADTGQ